MIRKVAFYLMAVTLVVFMASVALAAPPATTYDSKKFGPAVVAGALVGAKTSLGLTPTDVYDPLILGDALIYGYYNVRNGETNLFSVVNTDLRNGQRVRIRFYEGKTSYEVLDFDICLTPGDVWLGYIMKDSDGVGRLYSLDMDTYVDYGSTRGSLRGIFAKTFPDGVQFRYGAANNNITADQTLEGYFVVIGIEGLRQVASGGNCAPTWTDNGSDVPNVLSGHSYNINLNTGKTFAYVPVALANFNDRRFTTGPTDATPELNSGVDGINGVNFVLTKENLSSMFYTINAGTQLIVTFPTKRLTQVSGAENDIFDDPKILISIFDDAERSVTTQCTFSPCPPGQDVTLPNEVNVIRINNSAIFNTSLGVSVTTEYNYGWVNLNFVHSTTESPVVIGGQPNHRTPFNSGTNPTLSGLVAWGMPAIGYVVTDLGGGWNWMLPMHATYFVNNGTVAPAVP